MSSQSMGLGNAAGIFARDFKYAVRSLTGAKGLTITVVLTLPRQVRRYCASQYR